MNESSKSLQLPHRGPLYAKYLNGHGIDIGSGPDPLVLPGRTIDTYDTCNGDAQYLCQIPAEHYDFVHSSHCAEHMQDWSVAFGRWCRVLKPGGYMMVTIPSWTFYELCRPLPSIFNPDHKQCFCVCPMPDTSPMGSYHSVGAMLRLCKREHMEMVECFLELDKYDFAQRGSKFLVDQTLADATAQLCYVFYKPPLIPGAFMDASTGALTVDWSEGMRVCPTCKAPLGDGEKTCRKCG